MASERWNDVERLYHDALTRDGDARIAFLDEACAANAELRGEVESLLRYDSAAAPFLERPAIMEAALSIARTSSSSLVGRQLGDYQIVTWLGAGGMGEVYRATDVTLGRDVALKVLTDAALGDPGATRRFEDEARSASVLNHPNIVTIYGVGAADGVAYIAMELVEGRTLDRWSRDETRGIGAIVEVAAQLADALVAAHAAGIVHRDLKPDNVMVMPSGLVKVLDFGIAKRRGTPGSAPVPIVPPSPRAAGLETQRGVIVGTIGYMSPEQARGLPADYRSDQFAFGVMLYELLAGRRAFARASTAETMTAIVNDEPEPLAFAHLPSHAPLGAIVSRCLAKAPADRYDNTATLARDLRRILADIARAPSPQTISRRQMLALGGAAALSTAGVMWWRNAAVAPAIRSIAVLPLANPGQAVDLDYLCEGLADSLIQRLSSLPMLKVRARSASFNFRSGTSDIAAAAQLLAVDAVVTGAVNRAHGRVHVELELVGAAGTSRWRRAFDVADADLPVLEQDLARALVDDGIGLRLAREDRRRLARSLTTSSVANDLYLRARYLHRQDSEAGNLQARDLLQEAVTIDGQFARAFVALSETFTVSAVDGYMRPVDAWPQALRSINRALRLDADLPDAHAEKGSVAFFFTWDWDEAEREWEHAIRAGAGELSPDLFEAAAMKRWATGATDAALQRIAQATLVDPISPHFAIRHADFLVEAHRFDEAAAMYEHVLRQSPDEVRARLGLAEAKRRQGRFDEAIQHLRMAYGAASQDMPALKDALAHARGAAGCREIDRALARLELEKMRERAASNAYLSPLDVARAHARLGNDDEAFLLMERAFEDHSPDLVFLEVDHAWDDIRHTPRFIAAMQRVGLV